MLLISANDEIQFDAWCVKCQRIADVMAVTRKEGIGLLGGWEVKCFCHYKTHKIYLSEYTIRDNIDAKFGGLIIL